jgi:hypothetical protein
MNVTKEIIGDLLPLYAANECSADSRALIEQYLRDNPTQAEELRRIMDSTLPGSAPSSVGLDEVRSLREARRRVRRLSWLMGLAIFFSLVPFSFLSTGERTYWLLIEYPRTALIYGILGVGCWIAYATLRHKSKTL